MTRLAVLADIHGNLPALEVVLDDVAQFDVDHIIVVGDVVNWGPLSVPVLERLAQENCTIIRGNNERYVLDYNTPRMPDTWKEYVFIPWLYRQLEGYWHSRIAAWPDEVSLRYPDAPPARVMHGVPGDPFNGIYAHSPGAVVEAKLVNVEETTFITAHTHLALDRRVGGWHILNPGSVGNPLDGELSASYMILEGHADGWRPTFRRLPMDAAPVLEAFERSGFVEACGPEALLVIEEFKTGRLRLLVFQRWRKAVHNNAPPTFEMVEQFRALDRETVLVYTPLPYRDGAAGDASVSSRP